MISRFSHYFREEADVKKHKTIIVDNVTDIIDRWLLELGAQGKNYGNAEIRDYQTVYNGIKRLARKAAIADIDVIFNFWQDSYMITQPDGTQISMISPKMPQKILENICGLANIVAHIETVEKDGETMGFYRLGSNNIYAKDQLYCRKTCMPEDLFNGKGKK